MPIELNYNLLKEFGDKELKIIKLNRKISIILALIGIGINICVYFFVTFLSFRFSGAGSYIFVWAFYIAMIDTFYMFTWVAIGIASFSVLLNIYLIRFTVNPFIVILKKRKDQDLKKLTIQIKVYKKTTYYRMICQLSLWIGMIFHLTYYPQRTRLFYPFIGCNEYSGYCVIADASYFQYVLIMSGFFLIFLSIYILIIIINKKEFAEIQKKLKPIKTQRKIDLKKQRLEIMAKRYSMTIEERRKLKIEQLQESHRLKVEKRRAKLNLKFQDMLEQEQYGKKGFKRLKKEEKQIEKDKLEKIKKKKDEYDFT